MSFDESHFPPMISVVPVPCVWPWHGWILNFYGCQLLCPWCVALGGWWFWATIQDWLSFDPCGCLIVRQAWAFGEF